MGCPQATSPYNMAVNLGSPSFQLHPLHGVHEPTTRTPPRRPRSVRRTTSIDMTRDPGALDPVYLSGSGRDLSTGTDGATREFGRARLAATIDMVPRVVQHIETTPVLENISRLVGAPAMSGFRAAADKIAPQLRQRRELLYTLLDDIPVATLISGHALSASGLLGNVPRVLPWQECPGAVGSASRITGMTLTDLHFRVRQELTGTATCTHLNDMLRSVADTGRLIEHMMR
jgi:Protein of unknown function (DUF2889)